MNPKTLLILAGVTVAVGVGAYFASRPPASPNATNTIAETAPFLPELRTELAKVTSIEIKDGTRSLNLRRADPKAPWTVAEKDGFPVGERIQPLLAALVEMKVVEPKTSKPELFGLLGVDDVTKAGSTAKLITLKDGERSVASVLIGNSVEPGDPSFGGGDNSRIFARKAGGDQAFLVTGPVSADTDPMSWIERTVLQVDRNVVKSVTVTRHDDPAFVAGDPVKTNVLEAFRDTEKDLNFKVRNMPAGRELLNESEADKPTTAIGFLSIEDVKPRAAIDFDKTEAAGPVKSPGGKAPFARSTARFAKFDGMVITARVTKQDGKAWLALGAEYDEKERPAPQASPADEKVDPTKPKPAASEPRKPEDVKKDVEAFNAKHGPWAYLVQEFIAGQLSTRLEDLLKAPPPPTTVGPEPAGPQPATQDGGLLVPNPEPAPK
jgi:hypothetical protein